MTDPVATPAPQPQDEAWRLARLHELALLDTPPEPLFDTLTRLAASICGAPMAMISLMDAERQWFKSCVGMEGLCELPRGLAFCAATFTDNQLLEVSDAAADPRFATHPMVVGAPHIRFYAGVPLQLADGARIGTLCVVDPQARVLQAAQREQLQAVAAAVIQAIGLRQHTPQAALQARDRLNAEFHALAEACPVGVFKADAQGRCTYTNPAWHRMFGISLSDSLGEGWSRGIHPDDRQGVFEHWRNAIRSGIEVNHTTRSLLPDGSVRWAHARAREVRDSAGQLTGYVGVVVDETERRELERRVQSKHQLLDRAGRMAGVGGWEIELDGRRVIWTDETARIHDREPGYQPTLEEGISYYAPEARVAIEVAVRDCIDTGQAFDVELPLITAKGRHIWVRAQGEAEIVDGKVVRLFGAFQDITPQRAAASHLRDLFEKMPAMVQSTTTDGVLLNVSDLWLFKLGYAREQVVGRHAYEFLSTASREHTRPMVIDELKRLGFVRNVPMQVVRCDGQLLDVQFSAIVQTDNDGRQVSALGIMEDMTETVARRSEAERERRLRQLLEEQAEDLSRLASERRDMLDVLAHEVRQPLNNASAALQSAQALVGEQGDVAAGERLQRAANVMGEITRGLDNTLAAAALLASGRKIAVQDADIGTLLQMVLADLPPAMRARVQVRREGGSRTAAMDSTLMRLALRNLLANALRLSPADAPVEMNVVDSDEPLGLLFEVVDRGPGVSDAVRPHLFERGRRGPGSPGQGLGLYIARRVMELHGGRAELVATTPGRTVFRLLLAPVEGA